MPPRRLRLDAELVRRGLAPSRATAREAVDAGLVTVDGAPALKASRLVAPHEAVLVLERPRFVSRGGDKLDGALDRFPRPDIVIGQHVTPFPAGVIGVRPGPQMSASDGLHVVLHGRGGHGSRPHSTIDPVVMAAATVMRLQTVVSREVDPHDLAVVTVGAIHAGTKNNIIPAEATLDLSLRYPDDVLRSRVLAKVERVIKAEAMASGATVDPTIETLHTLPATINDDAATERATGE